MAVKIVRDSKFRHVFGDAQKAKFEDLRLANKATESCGVRGNSLYFAFGWESGGGGSLAVVDINNPRRLPRDQALITGHSGAILDFEFCPFDDSMLISASEDSTVKLWQIPEGGLKGHLKEPLVDLKGHGKKVSFCAWNPVASSIIATTSFDQTVKCWNVSEQAEAFNVDMPDLCMSFKWNYTGTLLGATCKDKKLRIIDPRVGSIVAEGKVHSGAKAAKVEWMGNASETDSWNEFCTTGFSKEAERQIHIWDLRTFGGEGDAECEPVTQLILDEGTGALYPTFDRDTQMLYVAGKGDANVRYFEWDRESKQCYFISQFGSTAPQKGFDFLPKRCCDVSKHEIMRGMKVSSTAMELISFKVPRKSDQFQDDLFPDAVSGEPSMTPDEWIGKAEARPPPRVSMKPGEGSQSPKKAGGGGMAIVSVKDLKKELAEAKERIKALEKENEALKKQVTELGGAPAPGA